MSDLDLRERWQKFRRQNQHVTMDGSVIVDAMRRRARLVADACEKPICLMLGANQFLLSLRQPQSFPLRPGFWKL
jgi:hypothetical protein